MDNKFAIPAVSLNIGSKGIEAIVGLAMTSIMSAEVANDADDEEPLDNRWAERLYHAQIALCKALASWPGDGVIELHWTAVPDIIEPSNGAIWISIFIRFHAKIRDDAVAGALKGVFHLHPLLTAHFPHLGFKPIETEADLQRGYRPFEPKGAGVVLRMKKEIHISSQQQSNASSNTSEAPGSEGESVLHTYPWIPAPDREDMLPRMLMSQNDPLQLIVRIKQCLPNDKELDNLEDNLHVCEHVLAHDMGASHLLRQGSDLGS